MRAAPLLTVVECSVCETTGAGRLYASTVRGRLCADCYRALGRPPVAPLGDIYAVHEAQLATRERMIARGGRDRYTVRAGKS